MKFHDYNNSRFQSCLQAKPYKEHSLFVWDSFFQSLPVRCFAYFPCEFENIWANASHRRTGLCYNNTFRVMEFDSLIDYITFVSMTLTVRQLEDTKNLMQNNAESFVNPRKATWKCLQEAGQNMSEKLVRSFESNFMVNINSKSPDSQKLSYCILVAYIYFSAIIL
jgi:hypothetical protein